jgi:hypothetical protein
MGFNENMIEPTPDDVVAFLRRDQSGLTLIEYTDTLYERYSEARAVKPIRYIRNQMIRIPEISPHPQENRAMRSLFMSAYVLGFHGSRHLLQHSTVRRVGMSQILEQILDEIHDTVRVIPDDNHRRTAFVTSTLDVANESYEEATDFHPYFESIRDQFSPRIDHQIFSRMGFGLAIRVGILTRDAEIDE